MKEREVTDRNNVIWKCNQALSGIQGELAKKAQDLIKGDDGKVPVVCTPSGGEKSVRVQLDADWFDEASDETLLASIDEAKARRKARKLKEASESA